MQFQSAEMETVPSILEEIFQEAGEPCKNINCQCIRCSLRRQNNRKETLQKVHELGWQLTGEEEYELSKAFEKIKDFAKKGYRKAKPWIVTADIVRRLIFPSTEPPEQLKDVASYVEQAKRRQTQDRIEGAQPAAKRNYKQKPPDMETSLLQEIFMEAENEFNRHQNSLLYEGDHTKGTRPSTQEKHEKGQKRKIIDRGGEKGDARRPPHRKRPDKWKGPWPPRE